MEWSILDRQERNAQEGMPSLNGIPDDREKKWVLGLPGYPRSSKNNVGSFGFGIVSQAETRYNRSNQNQGVIECQATNTPFPAITQI